MTAFRTAIAVALAAAGPAGAGAWSQSPGHYYAKLSGIAYAADEVYDAAGRRRAMGADGEAFAGRQAFAYLEYGLRPRLTLVAQASAGALTDESRFVRMETTGLGDLDLGLKLQVVDRPLVLAPVVSIKVPTGYGTDYEPPLGTGSVDLETRLLASRSLHPWPVYASVEVGLRARGGAYSNQVSWGGEVGVTPHPRLFAKLLGSATNTLARGPGSPGLVGGATQVSEGDWAKVGVNAAVHLARGLWLDGLVEAVVAGQNVGAGASWGLGLSVSR